MEPLGHCLFVLVFGYVC